MLLNELLLRALVIIDFFEVDDDLDEAENSEDADNFHLEVQDEHDVADDDDNRVEDVDEFNEEEMPEGEDFDADLDDEEGQQDVVDDVVNLTEDLHLFDLLGEG